MATMSNGFRWIRTAVIVASGALLVVILGVASQLMFPGAPRTKFLLFDGFLKLPQTRQFAMFDYLTVAGNSLFATEVVSGTVYKINVASNQAGNAGGVSQMSGSGAVHGVAVLPTNDRAFVTRSGRNTVDVFNPVSLEKYGSIPVADGPDSITFDTNARLIYVANGGAKLGTIIDPDKAATVGVIELPGQPEFSAVDGANGTLYQNLVDLDEVAALNLADRRIVAHWSLAPCKGPTSMAIDATRRTLFVVCGKNAEMVVFDLEKHIVTSVVKVGSLPDSIAFDAKLQRLYVAGFFGSLTVIQQLATDRYEVLERATTRLGAHTLVVDRETHKLYVTYANLFVQPRIAVFTPKY